MSPFQVTMPAVALSHLTKNTQAWLGTLHRKYEPPCTIAQYDEGFFIRIPACEAMADPEQVAEFCSFPQDLQHVFRALQPHSKHGWIMLDAAGDVWPGLSLYKE
jgi:hypothetical protein